MKKDSFFMKKYSFYEYGRKWQLFPAFPAARGAKNSYSHIRSATEPPQATKAAPATGLYYET